MPFSFTINFDPLTMISIITAIFLTLTVNVCRADLLTKARPLNIDLSSSLFKAIQSTTNSCDDDMNLLDGNEDLQADLQNVTRSFDDDFDLNPFKYCSGRRIGQFIEMECAVNYTDFSTNYIEQCNQLGGRPYPVSLLMRCSSDALDLDFELMNVPSCLGKTCDLGEVYSAILDILESTETSISSSDDQLDCRFYHDYDTLASAPIPIEPKTPIPESTTSSSASEKGGVIMALLFFSSIYFVWY